MPVDSNTLADREQRLEEAILVYLKADDSGQPLSPQELITRFPDLTADLTDFFADQSRLDPLLTPLRRLGQESLPPVGDELPTFGAYELLGEIGRGGMGVVYKARQKSLNRLVAIKMIRAGAFASDAEVRRFRNEAEAAATLDHPHIVPIHEVGEWRAGNVSPPIHYFSMKLMEAGSLAQNLDRFRTDLRSAARLVVALARAVHHAHQRGILHRDLKPSNILLDAAGQPHITDFGLARRTEGELSLTETGAIVGTPTYMAPEQALGKKGAITTATDVYGLGTILYALLTGRPPFLGDTPLETLAQVKEREPQTPSGVNRLVDRDLETICLKCLDKDAGRRYSSAEALAEDLENWLAGKPIKARPISRGTRLWRWCRRNPLVAGLTVAVIALVLLAVAGLTTSTLLLWQEKEQTKSALAQAQTEREAAEEQRRIAQNRATEADMQRRRAESHFGSILTGVRQFPDLLRRKKWSDLPYSEELREAIAERVRFHEELFLAEPTPNTLPIIIEVAEAFENLGDYYGTHGDSARALAAFRKSIRILDQLENQPSPPWRSMAQCLHIAAQHRLFLGQRDEAAGDFQRAVQWYQHAYAQEPTLRVVNCLTWLMAMSPGAASWDPELAAELTQKSMSMEPKHPGVWHVRGTARYRAAKYEEALAAFQKAMELRPNNPLNESPLLYDLGDGFDWFYLALTHWKLGNREEARGWYSRADQWLKKEKPRHIVLWNYRAAAANLLGVEVKNRDR
jgi:tetratricopeptide (TPR) repeat protein